jgi:hypothetical protein
MMATAVFRDLNNEQAHGVSCIVCGTEFTITGVHAAPSADRPRPRVPACLGSLWGGHGERPRPL